MRSLDRATFADEVTHKMCCRGTAGADNMLHTASSYVLGNRHLIRVCVSVCMS